MTIFLQFLRSLRLSLDKHLHLQTDSTLGTQLTITPWNKRTFMKIRLVLSWVEGGRVRYLGDAQVNQLFKEYCIEWYPNHCRLREQGYRDITNMVPE